MRLRGVLLLHHCAWCTGGLTWWMRLLAWLHLVRWTSGICSVHVAEVLGRAPAVHRR